MAHLELTCAAVGKWRVVHTASGASVTTDLPPEYGGSGSSFSATDLLAAALGVCIATNIDSVAERHGVPLDALAVAVEKTLTVNPKRLAGLDVTVRCSEPVAAGVLERLERAASHCLVHRSLHRDVAVTVTFQTAGQPDGASR